MAFSNHIPDEDRDHLYSEGLAAQADAESSTLVERPADVIHWLEEQRRTAVADLHAHQAAHKGRFAETIPCFMDSQGTCHGIGEQIAENADKAIEAHQSALVRYYSDYFHSNR